MILFTSDARLVGLHEGDRIVLEVPPAGDEDPAVASDDFSSDVLAALAGEDPTPSGPWRVAALRSIARHGASALDSEVRVTVLVPGDFDGDEQQAANQVMMRLMLALAG